jgi:rod shape determining protein RodA
MTLFDPFSDALGSGYQTIQSMIALGSGGLIGKGWGNATQTYLDFLPESSTDFIFAVFSEEFGFLGVISALILYLLIFYRCMFMVTRMQDTFSRILSLGILMSLFFGLIINLGMISGILPIVGVPLPLFSYGGTSMVVSLISIGIIMTLYNNKTLIAN